MKDFSKLNDQDLEAVSGGITEEDIRRTVSEAHLRLKRGEPAPAEQVSDRGDEAPCSK